MAPPKWFDRILEQSTSTGTGDFLLSSAVTGYRRFNAVCAVNDVVHYCIEAVDGDGIPTGDWETGIGTYSAANTLTRTTVLASTNADALVNFPAGTKRVMLTPTSPKFRTSGILFGSGAPTSGTGYEGDFYFDTTAKILYGPKAALGSANNGRYWGMVVDSCVSTQIPSCGEMRFYDSTNTLIAVAAAAMIDNNGTYPSARMIDGDLNNFALSNRSGQTPREIFWFDLTTSTPDVQKVRYYRRNDGFGYNEAAVNVRLFASAAPPSSPWTPTTHKSQTFSWGGSHGAGVLYNEITDAQFPSAWPIALS